MMGRGAHAAWLGLVLGLSLSGCGEAARPRPIDACEPDCEVLLAGLDQVFWRNMTTDGEHLYIADQLERGAGRVFRLAAGQPAKLLAMTERVPGALDQHAEQLFWVETVESHDVLRSMPTTGGQPETILDDGDYHDWIGVDARNIYLTRPYEFLRLRLDGGAVVPWANDWAWRSTSFDAGTIFFSDQGRTDGTDTIDGTVPCEVRSVPAAGGTTTLLVTAERSPVEEPITNCPTDFITARAGNVFWIDSRWDSDVVSLQMVAATGGEPRVLLDGITEWGLRLDATSDFAYVGAALVDGRSGIFEIDLATGASTLLLEGAPPMLILGSTHLFFLRERGEKLDVVALPRKGR